MPSGRRQRGNPVTLHRCDEAISTARKSFDKARVLSRVAQYLANLVDGCIQIVVDIDKRIGPELTLEFLSGHYFAGTFQQDAQHLKWLAAKFQFHPSLAQFARPKINLEIPKP